MIKVSMLGYRDWAKAIFEWLYEDRPVDMVLWYEEKLEDLKHDSDIYFLLGWSDIVPLEWYKDKLVLVLHPSPLPLYRGGSPIQHQIINGERMSRVTLFRLDPAYPAVDSGPIHSSFPYSLDGDLKDVLRRITDVGGILVQRAIEDFSYGGMSEMQFIPQHEECATTFKRRKPSESEIFTVNPNGLAVTGTQFHNKVRALQDPYPNAYIQFPDGRLYIEKTRWEPNE